MLPTDVNILYSYLNTKLRDGSGSLESLCDDLDEDCGAVLQKMEAAGFRYDRENNRFVPVE